MKEKICTIYSKKHQCLNLCTSLLHVFTVHLFVFNNVGFYNLIRHVYNIYIKHNSYFCLNAKTLYNYFYKHMLIAQ